MVMVMMVMVIRCGFFFNSPAKVKKVINGTRKLEGTMSVVAINLVSFIKKTLEKRMIKIRNRDDKSLRITHTILLRVFFL